MASGGWLPAVKVVVVQYEVEAVDYNSFSRQQDQRTILIDKVNRRW